MCRMLLRIVRYNEDVSSGPDCWLCWLYCFCLGVPRLALPLLVAFSFILLMPVLMYGCDFIYGMRMCIIYQQFISLFGYEYIRDRLQFLNVYTRQYIWDVFNFLTLVSLKLLSFRFHALITWTGLILWLMRWYRWKMMIMIIDE